MSAGTTAPGSSQPPFALQLAFGALSGCGATAVVQPIDLVKTRMQLAPGSRLGATAAGVLRTEGPLAFYRGLTAALLRQVTYTGPRLGIFTALSARVEKPGFATRLGIGSLAGGLGAIVGNPAEVCARVGHVRGTTGAWRAHRAPVELE